MKKELQPADKGTAEKQPRVGDIFDLAIATLDEEGRGIGRSGDMPVLVAGVLPGETVRVKVAYTGRREINAIAIKVLRHNPARLQTPPCANEPPCFGCPLVIMKYPAQLDWKRGMIENALRGYAALNGVTSNPVTPSPGPLQCRNSASFAITGKFTAPVIGIFGQSHREVTEIGDCPLYHPLVIRVVNAVKEGIRKGKVPVYSERNGSGLLRYLVVRVSETENRAIAVFVTAQRSFNEIHHLGKFLQVAVPEVEVVVQNVNSSPGRSLFGEKDHFLTRKKSLVDTIGDIRFVISPRSQFPVNRGGTQAVYEKVREWARLSGRETIFDLFCGNGGIALHLARGAKTVVGVETGEKAVLEAENNARLNGIRNCRFEAGPAMELLAGLREEGVRPDLIVINAPHKGCGKDLLQRTAAFAAARIIHLAGSGLSLAQDLDMLAQHGYRILEVQPVDIFPQTPRVNTVALLVKV